MIFGRTCLFTGCYINLCDNQLGLLLLLHSDCLLLCGSRDIAWPWCVCMCVCVAQIRKDYYDENIQAGPQSRILEGVTWEEVQKRRVCLLRLSFPVKLCLDM